MKPRVPYKMNVPGDFYVEDGECLVCHVPESEAPDLIGADVGEYEHCFVKKQPETPEELERMFHAIRASCIGCLRYRGTDPRILKVFRDELGDDLCDNLPWWRKWFL